jgi:hypothetical protein
VSAVGDKLVLRGKTQKGRNRVRENGAEWEVIRISDKVLFDDRPGPWLFVNPTSRTDDDKSRWIHSSADKDFEIVEGET